MAEEQDGAGGVKFSDVMTSSEEGDQDDGFAGQEFDSVETDDEAEEEVEID